MREEIIKSAEKIFKLTQKCSVSRYLFQENSDFRVFVTQYCSSLPLKEIHPKQSV